MPQDTSLFFFCDGTENKAGLHVSKQNLPVLRCPLEVEFSQIRLFPGKAVCDCNGNTVGLRILLILSATQRNLTFICEHVWRHGRR